MKANDTVKKDKTTGEGLVLLIDIGNSNIVIGCAKGEKFLFKEGVETDTRKTRLEYAIILKNLFELNGIDEKDIVGGIISSVVPQLTGVIKSTIFMVSGIDVLVVSDDLNVGIGIKMDDPGSVGADLIAVAAGASVSHKLPVIIVDMGTATTITSVDGSGNYIGGVIMPGVRTSLDSLSKRTAQLPFISIEGKGCVIGKNTVDSMRSGIINGHAASIDGMVERFKDEIGTEVEVVATGGFADLIVASCKENIVIDNDLLLKGLKYIYDINVAQA